METEQRIDEQTRRRRRRQGKSPIRNRKEEVVEAQQGGIDGERSKGKPTFGNRTEAEVQLELERHMAYFDIATGKKAKTKSEEGRRIWLLGEEKVREAERESQLTFKGKEVEEAVVGEAAAELQTIKEKEEEVIGEAAAELQTIKETPPQDTKAAAAKEEVRATRRTKGRDSDPMADAAAVFRRNWKYIWTGRFGTYEDITRIPPMIYTDKKREPGHSFIQPMGTVQIFSVKIAEIAQRLRWPLDVFGMVVARDALDHNRNIIFHRTRDNCQTIFAENPYLELTGPSRAVVALGDVHLEVTLQVKGSVQSKDKDLSFLVVQYGGPTWRESRVLTRVCPSKLSTVELTFGSIVRSVEATISVQVFGGSWPDDFQGEFTANTTSLDDMKIHLLAFGDGKLPVAADGMVELSRRVVSVEINGELRVTVQAVGDQAVARRDSIVFRAQRASRCTADVEVGSCKMNVTVAWSLLSGC